MRHCLPELDSGSTSASSRLRPFTRTPASGGSWRKADPIRINPALNQRHSMRPSLLHPLFATAASLPGIGPKTAKLLDRLLAKDGGDARVLDLLYHLPYAAIDRRNRPKIADAPLDTIVTLEVKAIEHRPPGARSKAPYKVLVEDETGDVLLVFFLANHHWIEKSLPLGETRWIARSCTQTVCSTGKASPEWRRSSRSILQPKGSFKRRSAGQLMRRWPKSPPCRSGMIGRR